MLTTVSTTSTTVEQAETSYPLDWPVPTGPTPQRALLYAAPTTVQSLLEQARQQASAGVTSEIEELLRELSLRQIAVPHHREVRDYLVRYSDMIDLLAVACHAAVQRFAARAQLSLEVYRDPEVEDEYLTLYVRQVHYDEDLLDMIEELRERYEGLLADRRGWLLVTSDFRPPR